MVVSYLNSIDLLQRCSSKLKEFSLGCLWQAPLLFKKKKKLAEMVTRCYSLSLVLPLVVTRCHCLPFVVVRCHSFYHSLSLAVPLVVIRCHSLSFVITRCTTGCHSLSLDVPFTCLFNGWQVISYDRA